MDFDFSPEQQQLRDMTRRFLADQCSSAQVRKVLDGADTFDRGLWQGLADLGLVGVAVPEAFGGSGMGWLELCVVSEELGRALAPVPFVATAVLAVDLLLTAGSDEQKTRYLPLIARGDATVAVATGGSIDFRDGQLHGSERPVAGGSEANLAIVSANDGAGQSLFLVDLTQDAVARRTLETIDPLRDHAAITFDGAVAERLGAQGSAATLLAAAFDKAAIVTAFEQVGGADRTLEMARDQALERIAFGRQIGSFQAIKHMLADMYVETVLARSNAYFAAWALAQSAPELPSAAAGARVSATIAYRHCARNAIQVHGGMGFTWEHDCHLHFRRANLLAQSLGPLSEWETRLVGHLRDAHRARKAAA